MRQTGLLFLLCGLMLPAPTRVLAQSLREDAPVPGGTTALARAMGLRGVPDRARFVTELTRIIYAAPRGANPAADGVAQRLAQYLDAAGQLRNTPPFAQMGAMDVVPIPLPVALWRDILQRPIELGNLFSAVMGDRRAALLCHGLAALDDETLRFLAERPQLLMHLFQHDAGTFAAFSGSLRIRRQAVVVPEGEPAVALWEAVLEEKASSPDRFVRRLFGQRDGRTAYLYDALFHLDEPTRSFALGLWVSDAGLRLARFKSLLASLESFPGWLVPERPFARPSEDSVLLLTRVSTDATGKPLGPRGQAFWSRAFEPADLPHDLDLKNLQADGVVDAAWLSDAVLHAELRLRRDRLDQIAFGQRAFAGTDEAALPDELTAIRAFPRYRMLMLTLESMGAKSPTTYALAARHAQRLSTLDVRSSYLALRQFQGAVAILAHMVRSHGLDAVTGERLVASLSKVTLTDEGRYNGGVGRWVRDSLAPALGVSSANMDDAIIAALAGVQAQREPMRHVTWEARQYRIDFSQAETHRITQNLQSLEAEPVTTALRLEDVAEHLGARDLTVAGLMDAIVALDELSASPSLKVQAPRNAVRKVTQELKKIQRVKDLKSAGRIASALPDLVDETLGEALVAYAYAIAMGDPESGISSSGNMSRRHDFGLVDGDRAFRPKKPWSEPIQEVQPGVPRKVSGSLLGLDLGLAALALRRISSDTLPEAPVLQANEKATFQKTVALLNPADMLDADRDAIADAINRGRQRVEQLRADDSRVSDLADEIGMDGWRQQALLWSLGHGSDHVLSWFSQADLLYLGKPAARDLDAWGMAADALDGCICTRMPQPGGWSVLTGRAQLGVLATQVADLNLRVALMLRELELPASLAKGVLAAAMQDYVDSVRPLHVNDWLTLVRTTHTLSRERVEDYVSGLTVNGPLVPESRPEGSGPSR